DLAGLLGRVPAEVFLHQLVDTPRMLQRWVDTNITVGTHFVAPGRFVVGATFFVVAAEHAVFELVRIFDDKGRVRVVLDVFVMDFVVGEQVVDNAAKQCDISTYTNGRVEVGNRGRTREARVNHSQFGIAVFHCFNNPLEATGVGF